MTKIKLNVGASPIWDKEGWHRLDHKLKSNQGYSIAGDAENIALEDESASVVFSSHMIEHIPHFKLEKIILEFNRVLDKGGVVRLLSPDLKKIAKAYANDDHDFFKECLDEDENIRQDLGLGGMFMNFVVSPGQDTALFDRNLDKFIAGYAHLYLYDFDMLKIILEHCGFTDVAQKAFCESEIPELEEPLHVDHLPSEWKNLNQRFYKENNLIHEYDAEKGGYNINFKMTGFDRDPLSSLIVEAKKQNHIDMDNYVPMTDNPKNYNRYGNSLLRDKKFKLKCDMMSSLSKIIDSH